MRSSALIVAVLAVALTSGVRVALAEDAPAPAATQPSTTTTTNVDQWTRKEWKKAKMEWAKDKMKWADCRSQSKAQKLKGRKSWSFISTCMNTKS